MKRMTVEEFVRSGFLQEVNRLVLHPCGLALEVQVEADGTMSFGGVQDYRDDPEGMIFADEPDAAKGAERARLESEKAERRVSTFGWVVQPLGESP